MLKAALVSSKAKKYHGDSNRDAIPSGPEQFRALPMKKFTLKEYIKDKKLIEATSDEWKVRCLKRWSKVNRYFESGNLNQSSPAEVAKILDSFLPQDYLLGSDTRDAKTAFDELCHIQMPSAEESTKSYGPEFDWRELYLKLSIEEEILFINESEDIVGLYEVVEAAAEHVTALTLFVTEVDNLKSKHFYLTKTLTLLKKLKVLTLAGVGVSVIPQKALSAISKGLTNLYQAEGSLEKLLIRNFVIGSSSASASVALDIFQQCANIKALDVRKSDILSVKGGEFLSRLVSQSTDLISLYFDDALTDDAVGQHLADGLMRNNKLQSMTVTNHKNIGTSIANIVYNLAFSGVWGPCMCVSRRTTASCPPRSRFSSGSRFQFLLEVCKNSSPGSPRKNSSCSTLTAQLSNTGKPSPPSCTRLPGT